MSRQQNNQRGERQMEIRNSLIYVLPPVLGSILPFLTLPLLTRALSKEAFGAYALAQAYAIFLTGIANFGLVLGYERNFFEHRTTTAAAGLLYTTLAFVTATTATAAALTWAFKGSVAAWLIGSSVWGTLLFWTFGAQALSSLKNYYLTYFRNAGDAASFAWYSVDEHALAALFTLVLVVGIRLGAMGIALGQFAASGIVVCALAIRFTRTLPFVLDRRVLPPLLHLSWPLTPRILFGVLGTQLDKYMIGQIASVGAVGVYAIGQRAAQMVFVYMTALQNVFTRGVYEKMFSGSRDAAAAIGRYLTPFIYVSTLVALLVALLAEDIAQILAPRSYAGAATVIRMLCLYYGTLCFGKVAGTQLMYAKKAYLTSVFMLLSIGVNVALGVPLIRRWGVTGAAWGMVIGGLIMTAITFVAAQRAFRIRWERTRLLAMFATLYGAAGCLLLLERAGGGDVARYVVAAAALGVMLIVGARSGVVTVANLHMVTGVVKDWVGGWKRREARTAEPLG